MADVTAPAETRGAAAAVTFTACSANYLTKAVAMCRSVLHHNADMDVVVLLVDRKRPVTLRDDRIRLLWAEDLEFPDFLSCAFKYNIIELNTAMKPFVARLLLASYRKVIYLDPDVCVFSRLDSVVRSLNDSSAVFTPHALSPYAGPGRPGDQDLLRFGCFNLGFFAVSDTPEAHALLAWWHEQCLALCFYEPQLGLGVDQKWIDLAPAFFERVAILKDPGLNVAFWNLHERKLSLTDEVWTVNGQFPLRFVHFSSFVDSNRDVIADKQTRYEPGSRPDFAEAADVYRQHLKAAEDSAKLDTGYGFSSFDNGTAISPALRRIYAARRHARFADCTDPFRADEAVYAFAKSHALLSTNRPHTGHQNFKVASGFRKQQRLISMLFRLTLRLLGPDRYFALMRYLGHYSSILNQTDMLEH